MRLFDLHCDTLYECFRKGETLHSNSGDWDFTRGSAFLPLCQVLAVWIPDTVRGEAAWQLCKDALDYAHREASQTDAWHLVSRAAELRQPTPAGILAVEGGAALAGRPERVAELARRGVRLLTLTWNGSNELGNGCLSADNAGLTPCGKQVVSELERHHMVPDVSHLNEAGFWDVAAYTKQPFIASHSVSRAVHEHPRNLSDACFEHLCRQGGLVGITLCDTQLGKQTMEQITRHLFHFWERGGEQTVALGFDLDGTAVPDEWRGSGAAVLLAEHLLHRGITEEQIDRLFFGNAYRFFSSFLPQ